MALVTLSLDASEVLTEPRAVFSDLHPPCSCHSLSLTPSLAANVVPLERKEYACHDRLLERPMCRPA